MKTKALLIKIILALVMAAILGGCVSPSENQSVEPVNIAFVIGIADDETKFNDAITELSELPAIPGSKYAFISAEGTPTTIGSPGIIPDLSDRGYTEVMMKRVRNSIKADLTQRINSFEPSTAEIDIAASTELAVRNLRANATEGQPNILVYYCGGKSTTGLINMIDTPIYKLDINSSISTLTEQMNVDMSFIDEVVWYCAGDYYGAKQPSLSSNEKEHLKEFYEGLFYALGAKNVTFKDDLPSNESYQFADTPVSCMVVEGTSSLLIEAVDYHPDMFKNGQDPLKDPIIIPEDMVRYKPDSAEFLDPGAASEAIQPVAEWMNEHAEQSIVLYGTCAGDVDSDYTLWLGKERAESVKAVLVANGVDSSRISAVTVRVSDDPYHRYGLGTGAEASVNRKTVLLDKSSDLGVHILAHAY